MDQITLARPDDWHLHLRDGAVLADVVPFTARRFGRAIIMPNLKPPVTDADAAAAYRNRILAAIPAGADFRPLMTLYLTDNTSTATIAAAADGGVVTAVKLYPAGATTNSDAGVTNLDRCEEVLSVMEEKGLPLLVHGEVTHGAVDIFDREQRFIEERLMPLLQRHPNLRVVFEHITTAIAADFVRQAGPNVAATITPQHLLFNRNHMLVGGIRPHYYCLPILKRETDREALLDAATSGNPKFFLGTDSAPHAQGDKENACGCAGCFSAPAAIELYAEAFETVGKLDRLEGFASHFGADFYGLPRNTARIALRREPWTIPTDYAFGSGRIVPLWAGATLQWQLSDDGPHGGPQ